jgi:alpha-pyrone synthase
VGKHRLSLQEMSDFVYTMNDDAVARRKFGFLLRDQSIGHKYAVIPDFCADCQQPVLYHTAAQPATTAARMKVYETEAVTIGLTVAEETIAKSGIDRQQITHIITVSCTGMFAPGLEAVLCEQLGLTPATQRHTVNFMGCYAAFHAFRLADIICRADTDSKVLIVCVELCSLHFRQDSSDDNLLATYLFSDGASACMVSNDIPNSSYFACHKFSSVIIPEGKADMAWNIGDTGFEMILKRTIPQHIGRNIAHAFAQLLATRNLTQTDIAHYAIHPGGKHILTAFKRALALDSTTLAHSHNVLFDYGNMSSATILFVLKRFLTQPPPPTAPTRKEWLYTAAFGPGLTVESGLFELIV